MRERGVYYLVIKTSDNDSNDIPYRVSVLVKDGTINYLEGNEKILPLLELTNNGELKIKETGYSVHAFRERLSLDWYLINLETELKEKKQNERRLIAPNLE